MITTPILTLPRSISIEPISRCEELDIVRKSEELCNERGILFSAAGAATPIDSLTRDFGERLGSGCRRPYTPTYITSSGNILSCCFAPFGHKSAREYKEERVLGNIFMEIPPDSNLARTAILWYHRSIKKVLQCYCKTQRWP